MMSTSPRLQSVVFLVLLFIILALAIVGFSLAKNNLLLQQPSNQNEPTSLVENTTTALSLARLTTTAEAITAQAGTALAEINPTPTRTRPPRSFFVRPTLAGPSPNPEMTPSPTSFQPPETEPPEPYPGPDVPTATEISVTLTPTSTFIAPTPDGEIFMEPSLLYIRMTDRANGWGLTYNSVLRTTDGGVEWVNTTPVGLIIVDDFLQGFFLNANEGWVFVYEAGEDIGIFYRTKDGGNSWHSGPTPFAEASVYFLDSRRGWAMAYRSTTSDSQAIDVYTTTDQGSSWEKIHEVTPLQTATNNKIPFQGIKTGIVFKDTQKGWITGIDIDSNQAWLYTSNDGGSTWSQQPLALPTGPQTKTVITEPPIFFGPREGILPMRLTQISDLSVLYLTTDGGNSWTFTTPVPITGPISCPEMETCRIWDGSILASTDNGGSSWNQILPNTDLSRSLLQIDFADSSNGYALSAFGNDQNSASTLYFTGDGGRTWTPLW